MADIAASDVTYSIGDKRKEESGLRRNICTISFGDGSLTYPAGGIPLTAGKMGMGTSIKAFSFVSPSAADGYLYKYDLANNKVRIYQGDNNNAADAPLIELVSGSATPAATSLVAEVVGY